MMKSAMMVDLTSEC